MYILLIHVLQCTCMQISLNNFVYIFQHDIAVFIIGLPHKKQD